MFDFQKLIVYQKAKLFVLDITSMLKSRKFDRTTNDQLRRASFSIMLNIAEGSSSFSTKDRRHFMIISRGSAFECVAILEFLKDSDQINEKLYLEYYGKLEEISKMLFSLIKKS